MSRNAEDATATSIPSTPPTVTKLCHIVKRADFEGYGFNLHSEKIKPGQYIGKVDVESPAEAAGLKEGDRIIEVNCVPIGSETHKQVVQRIKAIDGEVQLLLIDVDGKGRGKSAIGGALSTVSNDSITKNDMTTTTTNVTPVNDSNGYGNMTNASDYQGIVQEIPGASANISSISMISTKRMSNSSQRSSNSSNSSNSNNSNNNHSQHSQIQQQQPQPEVAVGHDETDKTLVARVADVSSSSNNNNNKATTTVSNNIIMTEPPPPSAVVATVPSSSSSTPGKQQLTTPPAAAVAVTTGSNGNSRNHTNTGGLQLSMTAAEMRAKLMSKKKYDPKNESVDLKKKFEIIQKL